MQKMLVREEAYNELCKRWFLPSDIVNEPSDKQKRERMYGLILLQD